MRGCFVLQAPPCADVMHHGCVFLMSVLGRVLARRREAVAQHSWKGREQGGRSTDVCCGRDWQLMLSIGKFTLSLLLTEHDCPLPPPSPPRPSIPESSSLITRELWFLSFGSCSYTTLPMQHWTMSASLRAPACSWCPGSCGSKKKQLQAPGCTIQAESSSLP